MASSVNDPAVGLLRSTAATTSITYHAVLQPTDRSLGLSQSTECCASKCLSLWVGHHLLVRPLQCCSQSWLWEDQDADNQERWEEEVPDEVQLEILLSALPLPLH